MTHSQAANTPTSPRKRPRQQRSKATVDAILEAAAHILVAEGYDRASTNRVAERAGVSIGSLYQYFPNKEALVGELIESHVARMNEDLAAELARLFDSPPEVVMPAMVRTILESKHASPALWRVLREQIPRVGRMQVYERSLDNFVEAGVAYMEQWRARIRHADLRLASFFMVHTIDALTHAAATRGPEVEVDVLIREISDVALSYLLVRTPEEGEGP